MENEKPLVLEALIAFEIKAQELLALLAAKFGRSLNTDFPFHGLRSHADYTSRGILNNEWHYWFHGDACDFENPKTNQYLHAKIYSLGQFRTIDAFYLFKFIKTTVSLKKVGETIISEQHLTKLLEALEEDGELINLAEPPFRVLVLNRSSTAVD